MTMHTPPTTSATSAGAGTIGDPVVLPPVQQRPEDFDMDAWIDAVARPSQTVDLYNPLTAEQQMRYTGLVAAVADAEARLDAARRAEEDEDAERSITDTGSAGLEDVVEAASRDLLAFRDEVAATALQVTVTQVTPDERNTAERRAAAEGFAADTEQGAPGWGWLYWAAEHTTVTATGRALTPAQLLRLARRDVSGHSQVRQIREAIERISAAPTVPSSPGSSTSRAGRTSSAS